MSNFNESDEEFARRLQAQEMGTYSALPIPDAQTPLMVTYWPILIAISILNQFISRTETMTIPQ
jgi:hypothetical protein